MPESWFLMFRRGFFKMRRKLAPLSRQLHGTFDTETLRAHLGQRLEEDFDILMVHSSINHMSPYYTGSALELVKMLMAFCGPERTLVMPAFYFGDPAIGSVHDTFNADPEFNLRKSPSQMGLATELFRRSRGVIQSRHPVYRVAAFGPQAEALIRGHEIASGPAGYGTPFDYMAKHKTMIVGIGKSFHVMTQVHHVDEIMGKNFPVPRTKPEPDGGTEVTIIDGDEKVPMVLHKNGFKWRFNVAKLPDLLKKGEMQCWKFHNVPFFAARADVVTSSLCRAAREGKSLYDPT